MMRGKYFLNQHPATALSWKKDTIAALVNSPLVHTVVADQCMYGLNSQSEDNKEKRLPAMKPTRFMTNSSHMQARLSKRCDGSHSHQPQVGGRCRDAAFYPMPLVKAILNGIGDTADADFQRLRSEEEQSDIIKAISNSAGTIPTETDEKPNFHRSKK